MLIGELARQAGLTPDTIRFYEKIGLLDARHRVRKDNNYKEYGPEALERLQHIARIKCAGFTLNEIKHWLREWDALDPVERKKVALDKVEQIERNIAELEKTKEFLIASIPACLREDTRCS